MLPAAKNAAATTKALNFAVMMDHPFFLVQVDLFFSLSLLYRFLMHKLLEKYEENVKVYVARNVQHTLSCQQSSAVGNQFLQIDFEPRKP